MQLQYFVIIVCIDIKYGIVYKILLLQSVFTKYFDGVKISVYVGQVTCYRKCIIMSDKKE